MFQILHFADLHLDTAFTADKLPSKVGAWRRDDLRATLGRILTLARERRVDAVTIAGDLYDQAYAMPELAEYLRQQFTRLAPIPVFIAPGQHDPYLNESLYTLTDWPDNVTIFSQGKLSSITIGPGIFLWGAACPPRREYRTLAGFQVAQSGINLLLLHALPIEQAEESEQTTFLINEAALQQAGFNAALLGGLHQGLFQLDELSNCLYPGSPEPLTAQEAGGGHHLILLKIDGDHCKPELIPVCQWHYRSFRIDLTQCETMPDAVKQVEQALQNLGEQLDERLIVHIIFNGSPGFDLDVESLTEAIDTKAHLTYETRLLLPYDLERLTQEATVRGLLVRRFQEQIEQGQTGQERSDLLNALYLALQAFEGRQVLPFYEVVE